MSLVLLPCLSVCPSICQSVFLFLSTYMHMSLCLSASVHVCLSFSVSLSLSLSLSRSLSGYQCSDMCEHWQHTFPVSSAPMMLRRTRWRLLLAARCSEACNTVLSNPVPGSASSSLASSGPCSATGPPECEDATAAVAPLFGFMV